MMDPDLGPFDLAVARALVARAIDDIDRWSEERDDALLACLLCAAWPTSLAQDQ
jgi:hypothetical protein